MMKRVLFISLVLLTLPVLATANNVTGNWQAKLMGSTITAEIQQNGTSISGVANVYSPMGHKDVFHFNGTVSNGRIAARHASGHRFDGEVLSDDSISGILTTRDGHRVPVSMVRQ
jgi:hypothetical protein